MKLKLLLFLFSLSVCCTELYAQTLDTNARWTWMAGNKTLGGVQAGAYRSVGANNVPAARVQATTIWCDQAGKVWLFGGTPAGSGINNVGRNDLWVFDPSAGANGEWYWQGGADPQHGSSVGVKGGAAHADNIPKARSQAGKWMDKNGNFWLFGGFQTNGAYVTTNVGANDLWTFNPVTREWRWVTGDTVTNTPPSYRAGIYPSAKGQEGMPGGRGAMVTWTDTAGHLWLFGGIGVTTSASAGQLADIWKFDIHQEKWFWMGGVNSLNAPVDYNGATSPGTPGGFPGGRQSFAGWRDTSDNLYIFSGVGAAGSANLLSDMWRYNPARDEWTWIRPSAPNANYGALGVPDPTNEPGRLYILATATDKYNKFWMLGGRWTPGNNNMQNALWMYDPVSNMWTRVSGDARGDAHGVYGTKNVPDKDNRPGARQGFMCYCDNQNELWLFGGAGWAETGTARGVLNDLWRYAHVAPPTCTLTASITPSGNASLCPGDSVILRANKISGATYEWRSGTTVLPQNADSIVVKSAGNYTVKITDGSCDASSAVLVITIQSLPGANPSPSGAQAVCAGETLVLNAPTQGMNYRWFRNGSPVGGNTAAYGATQAGDYTLVVTNPITGCRDSSSVATSLTLQPLPGAAVTPVGAQSICMGDSISIQATNGATGHSYEWYRNGIAITGAADRIYKAGEQGEYRVKVTQQSTGCWDTTAAAVTVTVNPRPTPSITPTGTIELCRGNQELLTAVTGVGTGYAYQWMRDGVPIGTAATHSADMTGDYYVVVTDNNHCKDSSTITSILVRDRPVFTVTPADTAFCDGGLVRYEVHTQDTGLNYQWRRDNADILAATLPFYEVRSSGNYSVAVAWNNIAACGDSVEGIHVTVHPLPEPFIEWDGVILTTNGHYASYQWHIGGQSIPGATDSVLKVGKVGAYTVSVIDTNGCTNSSVIYNVTQINAVTDMSAYAACCTIYPNPATGGKVYIEWSMPVDVSVSSLDGKLLLQQRQTHEVDVSDLGAGMYLLQIRNAEGYVITTERLVLSDR